MIICDVEKLLPGGGYKSVPDLIVEVLSPSTAKKDLTLKKKLYEQYGVKEYWVVYPSERHINVFLQNEQKEYAPPQMYFSDERIQVSIFDDLLIKLEDIFNME